MTISKTQPMREAEIAAIDYINNGLSEELTNLRNTDTALGERIDKEVSRAAAAEKSNADAIATEIARATGIESGLKQVDEGLQASINAEYTRATTAESGLQTAIQSNTSLINGKFPVVTANIGDKQVTEAKLSQDLQTLLTFCKTLPAFEYGSSEGVTVPAAGSASVDVTFSATFSEAPTVFTEIIASTISNILVAHVTYVDATKATIKLYNGGTTQVTDVVVEYLALAGR